MNKHGRQLKYLPACFSLFAILTSIPVSAADVGILALQGRETLKVSKCRFWGYNDFSSYVFILNQGGSWDFYDGASGVYAPAIGTYNGTLNSRKFKLASSPAFTQLLKVALEQNARELCHDFGEITSHSPFIYEVKMNKNQTNAKVTLKSKFKGLNYYKANISGSFSLNGNGSYSIEHIE
ncbi:MAG: hypothetical protein ACRERY_05690 [Pseudomonas sp.]